MENRARGLTEDLGAKRIEKDSKCIKLISEWFSTHDPFTKVSICLLMMVHSALFKIFSFPCIYKKIVLFVLKVNDPMTIASWSSGIMTSEESVVNC